MENIVIGNLEVTSICNYQCPICVKCSRKKHMDERVFCEIVDKNSHLFNENGVWLHFYGEPLVHKKFCTYVKYIKSKGLKVRVSTNGSLLDEKRREDIANSGLDYLVVSISTLNRDTYMRTRGVDNLSKVVENTLLLKAYVDEHNIRMQIQAVMIDMNTSGEKEEFLRFFHSHGIDVAFHNFTNRSNSVQMDLYNAANHDWNIRRGECLGLKERVVILSNCEVVTCFCDLEAKNTLGNLKDYDYSVEKLLQNGKIDKIRNELKQGIFNGACAECTDWIYYQETSKEKYVTVYPVSEA